MSNTEIEYFNPFPPSVSNNVHMASLSKNFVFDLRRDHQKKNSYERRDYESVDEKSLS